MESINYFRRSVSAHRMLRNAEAALDPSSTEAAGVRQPLSMI
jgi:hypothetical protein